MHHDELQVWAFKKNVWMEIVGGRSEFGCDTTSPSTHPLASFFVSFSTATKCGNLERSNFFENVLFTLTPFFLLFT